MQKVPRISWTELQAKLASEWKAGEHVTLLGPTGSGKTHMALTIAELCQYVMVMATKRRDPLVSQLKADGYKITSDLHEITYTADGGPVHSRVVYWPQPPEKFSTIQRNAFLARKFREAFDYADKTGHWAVLMDETMFLVRNLKLERELENLWFQGRSQHVSVIACAQRPAFVPRLAYSSATYLFFWQTSDKDDLDRLRDVASGIPRDVMEENIKTLNWHEHEALFIDTRRRELARVVAPPR